MEWLPWSTRYLVAGEIAQWAGYWLCKHEDCPREPQCKSVILVGQRLVDCWGSMAGQPV